MGTVPKSNRTIVERAIGFDTIDSNSSYLTIPNINHTFSGLWECKVQNEVGFGSDFVHINVKCEYG
jgi:hypothetical protein